jgi:YVTN family beta-propeller protein
MMARADTVVSTITVGSDPQGVAINPAGTFAYVTNNGSNSVSKINLSNDTVVTTIAVGSGPWGVAINPAGTFAYVTNNGSNSVSKINLSNDTVVTTIAVGSGPWGVAINPAGTFAYVTNNGSNSVSKINLSNDTVDTTIAVYDFWSDATQSQPTGVAINPAGTFAYVTHVDEQTGSISKINLATDTVVARIRNTRFHWDMAINPAGTFAYVTNWSGNNSVSKINLATDTVVATIAVGECPNGVAVNPAGTFAYVTNQCGIGSVSKINLATDTVVAIPIGGYLNPRGVAINAAGTFAYVALFSTPGKLSKIALTTTDPQSITFTAVSSQLLGSQTVALSATASSTLAVTLTSVTQNVCTISGAIVTFLTTGECTIKANQNGGLGWEAASEVSRTFTILPSPPTGEIGLSIKNGDALTNTKNVILNPVWPEYATAIRISNDGGFAASKTVTKDLASSIDWELDDSVKGIFTKVVYIRFSGPGIDATRTYSDDIILDTTAPIIESSSGSVIGSDSLNVNLRATDDITGVDEVQISGGGGSSVTKDYATSLTIPLSDVDLSRTITSFGSEGRRSAFASSSIRVRVSDSAGNWSAWSSVPLSGVTSVGRFGTTSISKVSVKRVKIAGATTFDNQTTGLPQTGIGAVALNVTAVEGYDDKGYGFVTTYPCDSPSTPAPNSSNLNFSGGQTIPNAVIAPVSSDGYICFSVTGNTDLLVDAAGYFPTGPGFTSLTEPKRLVDTRSS